MNRNSRNNIMAGTIISSSQGMEKNISGGDTVLHLPKQVLAVLMWLTISIGVLFIAAGDVYAALPGLPAACSTTIPSPTCVCATDLEPNLLADAENGGAGTAGFDIVNAVFGTINDIMATMEETFYTKIVGNGAYQNAINALVILYVTVYGILILFSMAPARANEVIGRLTKIAILYFLCSPTGFTNFQNCVSNPALNTINDMITQFSAAGEGGAGITDAISSGTQQACGSATAGTPAGGTLNNAALTALWGPMTLVFSTTFAVVLIALLSTPVGWFMVLVIVWGVVEFLFMLLGAILTYIKGIVGMAFLFALAPIFIAFILFAKTKQIFFGWVNQLMGFFLTPVLLFAFLGFYSNLLLAMLQSVMFPTAAMNPTVGNVNYCWVTWFKLAVVDFRWWRPVDEYVDPNFNYGGAPAGMAHMPNSCPNTCNNNGGFLVFHDWEGPPTVSIVVVLYFLLLCHLGKNLSHFIEQIAKDISGGSTPGVVRGDTVGRWFSNNFAGGKGPGGIAKDFVTGSVKVGKGAAAGGAAVLGMIGKRGGGAAATAGAAGAKGVGGAAAKAAKGFVKAAMNPVGFAQTMAGRGLQGKDKLGQTARAAGKAIHDAPQNAANAVKTRAGNIATAVGEQAFYAKAAVGYKVDDAKKALGDAKKAFLDTPSNVAKAAHTAIDKATSAVSDAGKAVLASPGKMAAGTAKAVNQKFDEARAAVDGAKKYLTDDLPTYAKVAASEHLDKARDAIDGAKKAASEFRTYDNAGTDRYQQWQDSKNSKKKPDPSDANS